MKFRWLTAALVGWTVAFVGAATATSSREADLAGDPVKGKKVYQSASPQCSLCHKINKVGGTLGPDLSGVGLRRDAAWLGKYLPNPRLWDPANKMPPVGAKGKDLEDLIAYLLTLKAK